MGNYTEQMEDALFFQDDYVDDYEASTRAFLTCEEATRTFGQGLISFFADYCSFSSDTDPVEFLSKKCEQNGVNISEIAKDKRTFKSWFDGSRRVEKRLPMFAIAFALGLSCEDTVVLFHKVFLDRAFDFRSKNEIVYYYCLKNRKPWSHAKSLIDRTEVGAEFVPEHTVATQYIRTDIDSILEDEALIQYIDRHAHNLSLKNITAGKHLSRLISEAKKYAVEEATEIKSSSGAAPLLWDKYKGYDPDSLSFLYYVITDQTAVGEKGTETLFTKTIKDNHPSGAFRCFPEVKSFSKKDLSVEELRKAIVLLFSYVFWSNAKTAHIPPYEIYDDYRLQLDDLLSECGLPLLYPGNPFDWLFLYCTLEEYPLNSLRIVLGDVIEENEEQ